MQFGDELDFDAGAEGDLGYAEGTAGVFTAVTKNLNEELGSPVGHEMLFSELRGAVDQHEEFYDARNLVEVPDGRVHGGEELDGDSTRGFLTFGGGEACAELADPGFSVLFRDVARDEEQVASLHRGDKCGNGRCDLRQGDAERAKRFIDRHAWLLRFMGKRLLRI